jgi:large subunit ribosomal protein L5
VSRLREFYETEVVDAMMKKFPYKNKFEVPKIEKIVVNMGLGEAKENPKVLEAAVSDMTIISGQKPVVTKAKKINFCFQT